MKKNIVLAFCLILATELAAQNVSLSTNLLDWANLGTANLQAGLSFSRHFTLHAGARYNNWSFGSEEKETDFQNRARTVSLGARYWPWNVYSSWWVGAKAQVEEYSRGGLLGKAETEEGLAAGAAVAFGYSRMLTNHWNLDFGLGFWGGRTRYTRYRCPHCGRVLTDADGSPLRDRRKGFLLPSDDIQISLTYIF